jgi:hypothetical protein
VNSSYVNPHFYEIDESSAIDIEDEDLSMSMGQLGGSDQMLQFLINHTIFFTSFRLTSQYI